MSNLSSRPVSSEERDAFQAARVVMLERMPYLAAAAFALKPVAVPGLGTFACDQFWRVYMDPDLLVGRGSWSFDVRPNDRRTYHLGAGKSVPGLT